MSLCSCIPYKFLCDYFFVHFFFSRLLHHMKNNKSTVIPGSQEAENNPSEISNLFKDSPQGAG